MQPDLLAEPARMIHSSGEVWEEEKERPVFELTRLFDPYNMNRREYE